jgi:hypothetical protein
MAPRGAQDQGWIGVGIGSVHRWFLDAKDAGKFAEISLRMTEDWGWLPRTLPSFRL